MWPQYTGNPELWVLKSTQHPPDWRKLLFFWTKKKSHTEKVDQYLILQITLAPPKHHITILARCGNTRQQKHHQHHPPCSPCSSSTSSSLLLQPTDPAPRMTCPCTSVGTCWRCPGPYSPTLVFTWVTTASPTSSRTSSPWSPGTEQPSAGWWPTGGWSWAS